MSTGRMIELAAAVAILVAGVWLYRRNRAADAGYGSQGAVLLFAMAAIVGVHALGLLHYRPSQAELESMKGSAR